MRIRTFAAGTAWRQRWKQRAVLWLRAPALSRWRPGGGVASDVKNINLAFAGVGDRLEFFETLELALVGPVVVE